MKPALLRLLIFTLLLPLHSAGQPNSLENPFKNTGIGTSLISSRVMPADQAFDFSAFIEAPNTVVLLWEIADGYYLYRKSIALKDAEGELIAITDYPEGETVTDEFFGESEVYLSRLLLHLPQKKLSGTSPFSIYYQGCAKDRYCYLCTVQASPTPLKTPLKIQVSAPP